MPCHTAVALDYYAKATSMSVPKSASVFAHKKSNIKHVLYTLRLAHWTGLGRDGNFNVRNSSHLEKTML